MWWVDCVYMLSTSCDYVQQKIDNPEHRNLVGYLLLTDQLKKTSPPPNFSQIQTLQGVSRFFQFMLFFIVEMI